MPDNEIHCLRQRLQSHAQQLQALTAELSHVRKIFNQASAMARIGVWECTLADGCLSWSDVIYDIFDLPRGSTLSRAEVFQLYAPHSRAELEIKRAQAIAECGSFSMEAEVITPRGNRRWVRITASVEKEGELPLRIFGMKQDITEEKMHLDQIRELAENDMMTGLSNRARFQSVFPGFCESNTDAPAGLMLIDLDGFKGVNDTFGHAAGDACLKQVAERLTSVLDPAQIVARIGGDEFAALIGPSVSPEEVEAMAWRLVEALSRPLIYEDQPLIVGGSVGVAFTGPEIGPTALFRHADLALYAAKGAGRNRVCLFDTKRAATIGSYRRAG
ncbi:hypothetical protein BJF93_02575 [Xaviernesmea oryzae]|uniref:Diguanylate cyclase n=2 Tax=Xaviernesmea oryzae TaxID=464029 RepID=A0A1Q9AZM3_9HYPH|nr:hypothetical protein BJF93_02575 [Xaviernesmea oryzae]